MRHPSPSTILAFAVIVPMIQAWSKTDNQNDGSHEFEFFGKIEYPCGPEVEYWVVDVGVGTPEQVFPLLIDTTSNYSYVNGYMCKTEYCLNKKRIDARKSSTSVDLDEDARLIFDEEDEYVEGKLYKDKFNFDGTVFDDIEFIEVYNSSKLEPVDYAGSFALGFTQEELEDNEAYNNSTSNGSLLKRVNSASIVGKAPTSSGGKKKGGFKKRDNNSSDDEYVCTLNFGVDYSAISGEIAWLDLPTCDFGATPFWKTELEGAKFGDSLEFRFTDVLAAFDTATKNIEVPASDLKKIHEGLDATCTSDKPPKYTFKCKNAKDLTFSFKKYDITIPVDAWTSQEDGDSELCTARISEAESDIEEPPNAWRLGTTFIEEFYTIYSVERAQTGVALLVGGSTGVHIDFK